MELFVILMVILAAYCLGIREANTSWILNATKEQRKECRGKLYKVHENT